MIVGSTVSESYGEEYDAEVLESEGITITDENGVREEYMGMPAEEYDEDNPEVDLGGDFENAYGEEEEPLFGYGDEPDDGGLLED